MRSARRDARLSGRRPRRAGPRRDDGTFEAEDLVLPGAKPAAIAFADVDGDGRDELVVADGATTRPRQGRTHDRHFLLRNDGAGRYSAPVALRVPALGNVVIDWDGDGDLDLIGNHAFFDAAYGIYLELNQGTERQRHALQPSQVDRSHPSVRLSRRMCRAHSGNGAGGGY